MNHHDTRAALLRRCASAPWIAVATTIAACGGADTGATTPEAEPQAAAIVSPLINDDGSLHIGDPRARPLDAGAWTTGGRYATGAQARMLSDALRDDLLQVDVECCSAQSVELAVGIAWGMQAARNLPNDTPVLVRGADLRLAAAAANRLASGGLSHVWLVTP